MSQATPRKFSEKIAILERKQNEEQEQFSTVMRDVRAITSSGSTSRTPPAANSPYAANSPSSVGSDYQHYQQQPPSNQQSPKYAQQQGGGSSNDSSSKLSPEGPHPMLAGYQGRQGGSLPNVHQVVQQGQQQQQCPGGMAGPAGAYMGWAPQSWQLATATPNGVLPQQQHVRTRSPGAQHFHPYCRNGPVAGGVMMAGRHERMSQGDAVTMAGAHLQPPDSSWPKARSDPAIHTMMAMMDGNVLPSSAVYPPPIYPGPQQFMPGGSGLSPGGSTATSAPTSAQILPPHAPIAFFPPYPAAPNPNISSSLAQQPQMYITPAPQHIGQPSSSSNSTGLPPFVPDLAIGSLPNMSFPMAMMIGQQQPQTQMSQQQRHSTAGTTMVNTANGLMMGMAFIGQQNNVGQMGQQQQRGMMQGAGGGGYMGQQPVSNNNMPGSMLTNQQQGNKMSSPGEPQLGGPAHSHQLATPSNAMFAQSQSAPTSPAQTMGDHPLRQQWTPTRHFSASPDGLEVPNICVTGTDGGDIDCFQDLQDLHLDSEMVQMLKEPGTEQVDPVSEGQLLNN